MLALDAETAAGRLSSACLRLAVMDLLRRRMRLADILDALWREDPEDVAAVYDALVLRQLDDAAGMVEGRYGLHAERLRELRRPLLWRPSRGLTIAELADTAGVDRETMAAALEHHGYLELVPYGGRQRRRLLTDAAVEAGLGHNADAGHVRIGRLEGFNRAAVFPVIYPEHAASVLWTLDLPGIRATAAELPTKRARLRWLLAHHGYLPDRFVAELAGCAVRTVERARAPGEMSGGSYREPAGPPAREPATADLASAAQPPPPATTFTTATATR
jgi:hypothetical protein